VNISRRATEMSPFYVMELLEKARLMEARGEHVIHMEVGEPGFATPDTIKEAAVRALADGKTFYTHSLGIPELRETIARHYRENHALEISPDRIIVTSGSSGAFILLFAALLERGRTLAISDPGYPCYRNIAMLADSGLSPIPVSENTHYEVVPELLDDIPPPDPACRCQPVEPHGHRLSCRDAQRPPRPAVRSRKASLLSTKYTPVWFMTANSVPARPLPTTSSW